MSRRWRNRLLGLLVVAVVAGAIYIPVLRERIRRAARLQSQSIEQARRELSQPLGAAPGEPKVKTILFWASPEEDWELTSVTVELPLSRDPLVRSKQILNILLAGPVDAELRTLPPDAALLEFYLLPNGTAVAGLSESLATSLPSGIMSEKLAVDSILRTLEANVPEVQQLKILINGQESETLAGHLDLTGTFAVRASAAVAAPAAPPAVSAPPASAAPAPQKLTAEPPAVKLSAPAKKP
ncbi:MAG: GerMN domain-containing protein [Acidobacteriia bacterium]|nr:GerMN domain-containing protein [Terriglobia bacterium]